jgi:hypothetical protein
MFYVLVVILIFIAKPSLMFDRQQQFKNFGIGGSEKTLFSFGVLVSIVALVSFYLFAVIDLMFGSQV